MTRLLGLAIMAVVCAVAACGDSAHDTVTIKLFQATPDAIEIGQSTKLLFVVEPAEAKLSIDAVGDVTGQTQVVVSPTSTTVYHLTAVNGSITADTQLTVTVGPQTAVALDVQPAISMPAAGTPVAVTLTAVTASGNTAPGFRGTVHLSSTDEAAELPPDVVFRAEDAGVKKVGVRLKVAGVSTLSARDTANAGTRGAASVTVLPGPGSV